MNIYHIQLRGVKSNTCLSSSPRRSEKWNCIECREKEKIAWLVNQCEFCIERFLITVFKTVLLAQNYLYIRAVVIDFLSLKHRSSFDCEN